MFDVFAMAVYTKNLVHTYSSASLHHIYQTIFQMEKGASTHTLEYAQFKLRYRFFPFHTNTEKKSKERHIPLWNFSLFPHFNATFYAYMGPSNGNSIQYSGQNISTTNTFHFIYLDFFSCLLCLGILFARAYQWFHIEFICSLIFIWNVVLFFCSSHSLTQWYKQKTYDCNNICTSYGDIWSITSQNWAKRWEWGNGFLSNISFPSWSQFIYLFFACSFKWMRRFFSHFRLCLHLLYKTQYNQNWEEEKIHSHTHAK